MYSTVIVIQCLFLFQATMADSTMDLLKLSVSNQVLVLNSQIKDLKVLVEHQNTQFAKENLKFLEENAKLAKIETKIGNLESEIARLTHSEVTTTKPLLTTTSSTTTSTTASLTTMGPTEPSTTTSSPQTDTSSGVVFTRWGRRDCPAGISTPVYNGTVGGSWDDHTGAAVNHLCMPNQPTWDGNKLFKPPYGGYVYSGIYYNLPDSSLSNQYAPCAVCRAESFSTKVMIPGRDTCFPGWTRAYAGQLVSGRHDSTAATEYVCLDKQPQKAGSGGSGFGFGLYSVLARCGFSYQNEALLTCVVCLK